MRAFGQLAFWAGITFFWAVACSATESEESARALLNRILPGRASEFVVQEIPKDASGDVFELDYRDGKVVLGGSNGVAMASALNYYLKNFCRASVSLWGNQLDLPRPLPPFDERIRIVTPFKYRYCFNYCCFSYSLAWWDWREWERVIDWMALQGVNMPLAVTGQEAVWQTLCREWGLSDEEIGQFMVGPAYLPFGWMGCMDGWGGPLRQDWIERHRVLGKKILERERSLGMTPVLQGFPGHVPQAFTKHFPDATLRQLPSWCGFPGTLFVDPSDPLFAKVGKAFIEAQTKEFGTDHLYASDTFIEMSPPSNEPAFLSDMARAVYGAMAAGDPEAVWIMQGWLFVNNPDFWKAPQAEALLTAVPDDRMIVLDLYCESRPAWNKTESFYGKPWVWCIIQDFGDQVSLHGGLPQIAGNLNEALTSPNRGKLAGVGCIMEGLGYNPVVYDLMNCLFWKPGPIETDTWIRGYAERRYGRVNANAADAWTLLLKTAYNEPSRAGNPLCQRPALPDSDTVVNLRTFNTAEMARVWQLLLESKEDLGALDTYQYDVVHVGREVLIGLVPARIRDVRTAYVQKDKEALAKASKRLLDLMKDTDALLSTRKEFLLGKWLEDAKRWGNDEASRRHYEWNARNQITLWGPADSVLHDYAAKQWGGLIQGFYMPRWQKYLDMLQQSLNNGQELDAKAIELDFQQWEEAWTHQTEAYPASPQGVSLEVAGRLWEKYRTEITAKD
ncbi:MAG: alpha-N-acetylglucosaminidase [Candidatus Hydrogenedentes bacterium]|nr:alpha-N-acetylglucosaminidase [Candidatus Hydrogenedentota bacterium]